MCAELSSHSIDFMHILLYLYQMRWFLNWILKWHWQTLHSIEMHWLHSSPFSIIFKWNSMMSTNDKEKKWINGIFIYKHRDTSSNLPKDIVRTYTQHNKIFTHHIVIQPFKIKNSFIYYCNNNTIAHITNH